MRQIMLWGGIAIGAIALAFALLALNAANQFGTVRWQAEPGLSRTIVWAVAAPETAPGTVLAGTAASGLYRSDDGGQTWAFDDLDPFLRAGGFPRTFDRLRDITVSPAGEIFVATWGSSVYQNAGGRPGDWLPFFVPEGDAQNAFLHARKLLFAGPNRQTLYVATYGGVLTADVESGFLVPTGLALGSGDPCAGQAQSDAAGFGPTIPVHDLLAHPADPARLYAAIRDVGVCASDDAGQTWAALPGGPGDQPLDARVLAFSPGTPPALYLGTFGQGVFRLDGAGGTWLAVGGGDMPDGADIWSLQFAADGETLIAGTRYHGTFRLSPGGVWQKVEQFPFGALSLAIDPASGELLAGTWGGGLWRQEPATGAWQSLNMPALPLPINVLAQNDAGLFLGTDGDSVWRKLAAEQSWSQAAGDQNQGDYLEDEARTIQALIVGADGHTLYAGAGNGLYRSDDNGDTWRRLEGGQPAPANITALLEVGDGTDRAILAGTRTQGLHLYSPAQNGWRGPLGLPGHVNALAQFQAQIYASVVGSGLFKTTIPGGQPLDARVLAFSPADLPADFVQTLTPVHPTPAQRWLNGSAERLFAITERGLYSTRNGNTWVQIAPGAFGALAIDPRNSQVSYLSVFTTTYAIAATGGETMTTRPGEYPLLVSPNHGAVWVNATPLTRTEALTTVVTSMIADANQPGQLYAATERGLYRGQVPPPPLWRRLSIFFALSLAAALACLLVAAAYLLVARPFWLPLPRAAFLLFARFDQLRLVWEREGPTPLSDVEQLVLLNAPREPFLAAAMWRTLDRLGAAPPLGRLYETLNALTHRRGLLREKEGLYLLQTPDIKRIARRTFGRRVEQIRRQIRREQSVYRDVEQFFGQAGFDVNPLDSEYLLRPGAPARLPWGDVWAWLRLGEPLTPDEITELDGLARERNLSGPAFIVIAERPTPAAYRALMARNASDAPPLVPVDAQSIRRALAQRNPADTLDTLIRRAQPGYNHFALYTPVEDSLDFFGRQNILQTLAGRLTGGDPLLLTTVRGLPRVGLTSLLRRLQTRLEAIPCAAASLQYEQDAAGLRFAITRSLLQEARRKTPGATLSPLVARLSPARPGDPAVGQVFEALQQLSARQRAGRKFVVLVDATGPAAAAQTGLLREARSLAEAHPRLAFVLAANTFDQADLTLRPLSAAEAGTMVQSLLAAAGRDDWPPPVMDALFHYSGGHPWLLRQLGSALFKLDRFLEPADVEAAALALVERRSAYFEGLWDSLPQTAQNGLLNPSAGETTLPRELGLPTGLLQLWLELELGLEFEPGSL